MSSVGIESVERRFGFWVAFLVAASCLLGAAVLGSAIIGASWSDTLALVAMPYLCAAVVTLILARDA